MTTTEKHRETARIIAIGAASQVDNNDDARAVETLVAGLVETALANEFREGMKRAANEVGEILSARPRHAAADETATITPPPYID